VIVAAEGFTDGVDVDWMFEVEEVVRGKNDGAEKLGMSVGSMVDVVVEVVVNEGDSEGKVVMGLNDGMLILGSADGRLEEEVEVGISLSEL
jgi:hypothetical protein